MDGTMYQLAYGVSTPIFYYNADVLESAGLSGAPETWTDFFDTYLPALAGSKMAGFAYGPGSWWQQSAYWANGVMVNDENWEIDFANPLATNWFTQMQEARRNEQVIYPVQADQNAVALFGAGRAAMMIDSTGAIGSVDEVTGGKFATEVGFLPAGEAGRYVPSGGNGLSISKNASEANRAGAWPLSNICTSQLNLPSMTRPRAIFHSPNPRRMQWLSCWMPNHAAALPLTSLNSHAGTCAPIRWHVPTTKSRQRGMSRFR
jgi:ABC-type glycerol-3-phosphate transport system substrate-binding protein